MNAVKISARKHAARSGGFSIIEAIVAMGVVGIVIVSLYAALTMGFRGVEMGREDVRATQIMVRKMDQLGRSSWSQITNSSCIPTTFYEPFNPESATPTNSGPLIYTGTVTLSAFGDGSVSYSNDMRQVTIQLDWTSQSGMARTRSLTTFLARYGLQNYVF